MLTYDQDFGICESDSGTTHAPTTTTTVPNLCTLKKADDCENGFQTEDYKNRISQDSLLVGYADITYNKDRTQSKVCIEARHVNTNAQFKYYFDGSQINSNCRSYTTANRNQVSLKVIGDGTTLEIPSITLLWNVTPLKIRDSNNPNLLNGQKGAIVEMFGWPHQDVLEECQLLGKAGYLGVKLSAVHEQLISFESVNGTLNPWHFMYQPVSYKLDGRGGTRQELERLIKVCRAEGVRIYVDVVLNHFTSLENGLQENLECSYENNLKTSSAPKARKSSFYTNKYTINDKPGAAAANEFPGAAFGPDHFHCYDKYPNLHSDAEFDSESYLDELNNEWFEDFTDLNTTQDYVRERQAAYLVEMLSMGITGFRINFAKYMSPDDLAEIFKKVQSKIGGALPVDFLTWLEITTSDEMEASILWNNKVNLKSYGAYFNDILTNALNTADVQKIKIWDGLYPERPSLNDAISRSRIVIQNDDQNQQFPDSIFGNRIGGNKTCVLVSEKCDQEDHRNEIIKLFEGPYDLQNNTDWPIRVILSSYYLGRNKYGIPDGFSDCSLCKSTSCSECVTVPYIQAAIPNQCAYSGDGYTKTHRSIEIINSMRKWMSLTKIENYTAIGLYDVQCN